MTDHSGNVSWVSAQIVVALNAQPGQPGSTIGGPGGGPGGPGGGVAHIARIGTPHTLALDNGVLVLTGEALQCPFGVDHCSVSLTVKTRVRTASTARHGHSSLHTVTIGRGNHDTPGGGQSPLTVRLKKQGLALLARLHHLRVTVTVVSSTAGGQAVRSTESMTLNAPSGFGHGHKAAKKH